MIDDLGGYLHNAEDDAASAQDILPMSEWLARELWVQDVHELPRVCCAPVVIGEARIFNELGHPDGLGEARPVLALGGNQQYPAIVGRLVWIKQGIWRRLTIMLWKEVSAV